MSQPVFLQYISWPHFSMPCTLLVHTFLTFFELLIFGFYCFLYLITPPPGLPVCICLLLHQTVAATSVIAFSTLSHCSSTLTLSSISIFLSCNFSKYAFLISYFFSFHTIILGCTLCNPCWFFLYFLTFKCMSITKRL